MTSKEYIKEHLKSLRKDFDIAIKNNLIDYANKLVEEIKCSENILQELEILELIKKTGILDLVFSEEPYCNLVINNRDVINVDYDGRAPDIEMTWEEYEKFRKWLNER